MDGLPELSCTCTAAILARDGVPKERKSVVPRAVIPFQGSKMKPVLIGLNNPSSPDPALALFKGGTGGRIFNLLKSINRFATEEIYWRTFDRRNLTTRQNPTRGMLKAAANAMEFEPGATVVLLGRDVQRAFGRQHDDLLFAFFDEARQVYWRSIPHPSGRCLFYNDPVQRRLVGILLNDLYLRGKDGRRTEDDR